ncbi:PQQ-binding-like beta-propeller repeat protein [Haloarchaeobius sp. DFWS5]|uniref:outer membrane protein assembly factor BamB family protein n=1 Tax=Haloarchaeobius sp. DFWS5 TaxID=3446114 RepID=UPI003EB8BED0
MTHGPRYDRRTALQMLATAGGAASLGASATAAVGAGTTQQTSRDETETTDWRWRRELPGPDGANPTDATLGGYHDDLPVLVENVRMDGQLAVLGDDGAPVWTTTVTDETAAGPVDDDERVYLGDEYGVTAYDRDSGEVAWTSEAFHSSVTGVVLGDTSLYVDTKRRLFALDPATGAIQWRGGAPCGDAYSPYRDPVLVDGAVVAAVDDGLGAFEAATGEVRWSTEVKATAVASGGNNLYAAVEGRVVGMDTDSGAISWRGDRGASIVSMAADGLGVVAERSVDINGDELEAVGPGGDQQWAVFTGYRDVFQCSEPALTGGSVFVGTDYDDTALVELERATGEVRTAYTAPDSLISRPRLTGDSVFAASDEGVVYAFDR